MNFRSGILGAGLLAALLYSGCATMTRRPPPSVGSVALPAGFPAAIRWYGQTQQDFLVRATSLLGQARGSAKGGTMNILVLSGGGSGGAFGAGALVGWSQRGTRPQFQVVTGVSVGALIAPLAFLGSAWDTQLTAAFSGGATRHLLQLHWMDALFGTSLFGGEALKSLVDRYVSAELVAAVAEEARKGRLLLVTTTDLDTEQTVFWNLGVIAQQGGEPARKLFREVLVASASIPGIFPPVLIHVTANGQHFDEMHVDGSASVSLPFLPDITAMVPGQIAPLTGAHLYVLVNGQARSSRDVTRPRALPIFTRGVSGTLLGSTRGAIAIASFEAQRQQMGLVVTAVPDWYPIGSSLDFDSSRMEALFQYAQHCAYSDRLWAPPLTVLDQSPSAETSSSPHRIASDPVDCPVEGR